MRGGAGIVTVAAPVGARWVARPGARVPVHTAAHTMRRPGVGASRLSLRRPPPHRHRRASSSVPSIASSAAAGATVSGHVHRVTGHLPMS
mgnify:CR=1 FL=1